MVAPLIPLAVGSLAMSGLSNISRSVINARAYRQFARGYRALDSGYSRYLAKQGRKINPNRALTSYYGQYLRNRSQMEGSYWSAVGSGAGALGAGGMITSRWLA